MRVGELIKQLKRYDKNKDITVGLCEGHEEYRFEIIDILSDLTNKNNIFIEIKDEGRKEDGNISK